MALQVELWAWTTVCLEAVHMLKAQLTKSPVLAHTDPFCPTVVTCEASAGAVRAVLSQLQNSMDKPVAYTSRALSPTEQCYSHCGCARSTSLCLGV